MMGWKEADGKYDVTSIRMIGGSTIQLGLINVIGTGDAFMFE